MSRHPNHFTFCYVEYYKNIQIILINLSELKKNNIFIVQVTYSTDFSAECANSPDLTDFFISQSKQKYGKFFPAA